MRKSQEGYSKKINKLRREVSVGNQGGIQARCRTRDRRNSLRCRKGGYNENLKILVLEGCERDSTWQRIDSGWNRYVFCPNGRCLQHRGLGRGGSSQRTGSIWTSKINDTAQITKSSGQSEHNVRISAESCGKSKPTKEMRGTAEHCYGAKNGQRHSYHTVNPNKICERI